MTVLDSISFFLSGLSIIGALLNAYNKLSGFYLWIIANAGWIIVCIYTGMYSQIPMWSVYFATSIIGIIQWKKSNKKGSVL